jgi:hypothetical protein
MKLGLQRWGWAALAASVAGIGGAAVGSSGCNLTPAQDASIATAIEGAACQVIEVVDPNATYVPVLCQIANSITGTVVTLNVKVPQTELKAFLAANPAPDGGLPGVAKAVKKGP